MLTLAVRAVLVRHLVLVLLRRRGGRAGSRQSCSEPLSASATVGSLTFRILLARIGVSRP